MYHIDPILGAVDHVEAQLNCPLGVGQMADAVGYSLYHFSRVFNRVTHHTPYDYLMRRRVTSSATQVISSNCRIIDIAYDYQFANPEIYSRAFRRVFGCTPSCARTQGYLPFRAGLPRLTREHLAHRARGGAPHAEIVEAQDIHLHGLMGMAHGDLARTFGELWAILGSRVGGLAKGAIAAVVQHPSPAHSHPTTVFLGCEEPCPDPGSPPLAEITVPASMSVHAPQGERAAQARLLLDYVYHTWMPKAKVRPATTREIIIWDTPEHSSLLQEPNAVLIPVLRPGHARDTFDGGA